MFGPSCTAEDVQVCASWSRRCIQQFKNPHIGPNPKPQKYRMRPSKTATVKNGLGRGVRLWSLAHAALPQPDASPHLSHTGRVDGRVRNTLPHFTRDGNTSGRRHRRGGASQSFGLQCYLFYKSRGGNVIPRMAANALKLAKHKMP